MASPPGHPDRDAGPERGSPPPMPGWVKWPAITIGALILLFVVLQIAGDGSEHGPGRHGSAAGQPLANPAVEWRQ